MEEQLQYHRTSVASPVVKSLIQTKYPALKARMDWNNCPHHQYVSVNNSTPLLFSTLGYFKSWLC